MKCRGEDRLEEEEDEEEDVVVVVDLTHRPGYHVLVW